MRKKMSCLSILKLVDSYISCKNPMFTVNYSYAMRNLQFLFLLFFSFQCLAQQDTIQMELSEEERTMYPNASGHFEAAIAAFDEGQGDVALRHFQNVLTSLVPGFTTTNPTTNPDKKNLFANRLLSKVFKGKARSFELKYKSTGHFEDLKHAVDSEELNAEIGKHLLHAGQSVDPDEESQLVDLAYSLYEKTNNPSVLLQVFRLVEKSRKVRLLKNLQVPGSQLYANVPSDLIKKQHQQKKAVDVLLKKYLSAKGTANEAKEEEAYKAKRSAYQNSLFDIKKKFPDFYRLMYDESIVTVGEIQNRLVDADEAMVTFFETPKNIYAFVIALKGFRATRIKKDFSPTKMVDQLNDAIKSYADSDKSEACAAYRNIAHLLYQKVVSPLGVLPTKVVIVPEGTLAQLPFNALLSEPVDHCEFRRYPFLLQQHQISYHYGADLFAKAAYKEDENYGKFISCGDSDGLAAINQLMGGKADPNAEMPASILNETVDASLIHIALPATTNLKQNPTFYLELATGKRFQSNDIYGLNLKKTQMVFLEKCNVESKEEAEGLLDIVQGFQYAGAQSVLSSLWTKDETAKSKLLHAFYSQLRNGATKDAALRTASLELWEDKKTDLTHPVHWATYVAVGDMDAIKKQSELLYFIGLAPLVAMFYFWRRYLKKRKKK